MARGALSSWWSSLATPEEATPPAEPALEATDTVADAAVTTAAAAAVPSVQPTETTETETTGDTAETGEPARPTRAGEVSISAERRPGRPRFEAAGDGHPLSAASCP